MSPKVTVVLPVYNAKDFLPLSIASILSQNYQDFKLLIINDGSTDGSKEYLDSLKDSRIHVVHKQNTGLGDTLNYAIDICETEYLARMDADDWSHPDRLGSQMEYLEKHPDIGAVGCQLEYFSDHVQNSGYASCLYQCHNDIVTSLLRHEHALCHPTLIFRLQSLRDIGGYRIRGVGEDWDMFLRLIEKYEVRNLELLLYKMRLHQNSVTWKNWLLCRMNNSYSIECYNKRLEGQNEPTYKNFADKYQRNKYKLFCDRLDGWSLFYYRNGIINNLNNRKFLGTMFFIIACFFSPKRLMNRIKRTFGNARK